MPATFKIHVIQHKATGLLAAMSEDLRGFIVHAHSDEELAAKLGPAFAEFMDATGVPVTDVRVTQETPEGFWPPTYVASGRVEREIA
jgi:hypothetical protein